LLVNISAHFLIIYLIKKVTAYDFS